ncbi:hypothetical protein HN911_13430 [Candidatus Bathyarchaeota archaeon]|jgi:hypothetical protein|nr:hypothetical protein [Candidatus Bathyarchaeota archaeon]
MAKVIHIHSIGQGVGETPPEEIEVNDLIASMDREIPLARVTDSFVLTGAIIFVCERVWRGEDGSERVEHLYWGPLGEYSSPQEYIGQWVAQIGWDLLTWQTGGEGPLGIEGE